MEFKNSKTYENLARSYAGESQAGLRYQMIADKLMKEKQYFLVGTIKSIAKNEVAHAKAFYNMIIKHGGSIRNIDINAGYPFIDEDLPEILKENSEIEKDESEHIYKSFQKIAEDEGYKDVAKLFKDVASVENCHHMLTKEMYEKMKDKTLFYSTKKRKWKCDVCGYEEEGIEPWKECPLCEKDRGYVQITFSRGKTEEK